MAGSNFVQIGSPIVSTATFRAYGASFKAAFIAAGLVQTADTGQVDWATVNVPADPGGNTFASAGYEIWQWADPAQATQPVFIKMEYGKYGAVARPASRFTVGKGTNGTGTVTSIILANALEIKSAAVAHPGTNGDCWVAHGDGYMTMAFFVGTGANSESYLILERARNSDDTIDTSTEAGLCAEFYNSGTASVQCDYATGVQSVAGQLMNHLDLPSPAATVWKGVSYALPCFQRYNGRVCSAAAKVGVSTADVGANVAFTVTHMGGLKTYKCPAISVQASARAGIRYD